MIEIKDVDKTFETVHAVDHITAMIQEGMVFGGKKYADANDLRNPEAGQWRNPG